MSRDSKLIVFVAVLASLLEIIDTSIVNVALPSMMGNMGATLEDISMVITGYAIANAIVLPVSSWLGDRIGRRKYFLGCILAFTVVSVACGLAPNLFFLIVFRILQGLVGGALLPTSQTLIYEQFPKEKAGMAGAIFGMSVMIGPTLGPVMGGFLTDELGWRSIFNINLPLGLLALFVGYAAIKDRELDSSEIEKRKTEKGFDVWGLTLLVLGIGCLQYVLERGEPEDWFSSKWIIINTLICVTCLPTFVWWELKIKNPIINIRLFKESAVQNGTLLMACLGFFLYGIVFILPIFVNTTYHYTATQTGVLFIPGSILTAMMMPFIGKSMQSGVNPKLLIIIGFIGLEVCAFTMTGFSPQSSEWDLLRMLFIRGFALAFLFVPINSSILSQFKGPDLGQVAGLLNLSRQIGGSMGIALIATMLAKNSHQNYLDLSAKISSLNPTTQITYMQIQSAMKQKFANSIGMKSENSLSTQEFTLKTLQRRLQSQVFMLSFQQLVWTMMLIMSIAFIPIYRLRLEGKTVAIVDAH